MNKKTKMWLGVGVVAAAAYYFWHKSQADKTTTTAATTAKFVGSDGVFANAGGSSCGSVPCRAGEKSVGGWSGGETLCQQPNGMYVCRNKYNK